MSLYHWITTAKSDLFAITSLSDIYLPPEFFKAACCRPRVEQGDVTVAAHEGDVGQAPPKASPSLTDGDQGILCSSASSQPDAK